MVYASTRDWSCLYGAIRSEPETARSVFLLALLSVSGNTHTVSLFCMHRSGCSYCDASGEFCLPSLRVLSFAKALIRKKVSVAAQLSVHPSERSPTLPTCSSGLCVRQIENEQQSTVGEVTAAEGHGASKSTGWPRQRCTKSPTLRQNNQELVPAPLGAVKLL